MQMHSCCAQGVVEMRGCGRKWHIGASRSPNTSTECNAVTRVPKSQSQQALCELLTSMGNVEVIQSGLLQIGIVSEAAQLQFAT